MSASKDKNTRPIEGGLKCPKCGKDMQRYSHDPLWKPIDGRNYYEYWDRCKPCRHFQHYDDAKRNGLERHENWWNDPENEPQWKDTPEGKAWWSKPPTDTPF